MGTTHSTLLLLRPILPRLIPVRQPTQRTCIDMRTANCRLPSKVYEESALLARRGCRLHRLMPSTGDTSQVCTVNPLVDLAMDLLTITTTIIMPRIPRTTVIITTTIITIQCRLAAEDLLARVRRRPGMYPLLAWCAFRT